MSQSDVFPVRSPWLAVSYSYEEARRSVLKKYCTVCTYFVLVVVDCCCCTGTSTVPVPVQYCTGAVSTDRVRYQVVLMPARVVIACFGNFGISDGMRACYERAAGAVTFYNHQQRQHRVLFDDCPKTAIVVSRGSSFIAAATS